MRGASFIEFLITFGLFIVLTFYLFLKLNNSIIELNEKINRFSLFQDNLAIQTYFLTKDLSLKELENLNETYLREQTEIRRSLGVCYSPVIIKLKNVVTSCSNCIKISYNGNYLEIRQDTSSNLNSYIKFYAFFDYPYNYISHSAEVECVGQPLGRLLTYILSSKYFASCYIRLHGNSYVRFYNISDLIYIDSINSYLPVYYGNYRIMRCFGTKAERRIQDIESVYILLKENIVEEVRIKII